MIERRAKLALTGWHGFSLHDVIVIGETPKKYRIRPAGDTRVRLAGGWKRWLHPGETALVPKYAIRFPAPAEGHQPESAVRRGPPTEGET